MRLLLAEDEKALSSALQVILKHNNYSVDAVYNGQEAYDYIMAGVYDGVILDVMMPKMDGFTVLSKIRSEGCDVPVIMLTAKSETDDKINGLDLGADDYLAKPFHLPELSMRIYAIIRRKEFSANNLLQSNGVSIDLLSKSVDVNDQTVVLTRTEYELLLFLIGNKNRVISKGAMAEHLSGDMADMLDDHDFVYTHIKNLKAKLAEAGCRDCIKNIYGAGYKWIE